MTAGLARDRVALWTILILAAIVRVLALGKELYVDEVITLTVASQPLAHMADVMRQIDASPALYPLLLHVWLIGGHSTTWARGLSALLGVLVVLVVYRVGRRAFGVRTALCSMFVVAIAPAHIEYAQYVRSYSLFTLLVGLQLWIIIDWFWSKQPVSRGRAVAAVTVTTALLYTHYLSLIGLFVQMPLLLWWWRGDRSVRVRQWLAVQVVAALLFLPGVPLLAHNLRFDRIRNAERVEAPPARTLLPNLMGELSLGQRSLGFDHPTIRRTTLAAGLVVFPTLLMLGFRQSWTVDKRLTVLLTVSAFGPMLVYILSGRKLVAVRFFIPFMIGYIVLLGRGLASIRAQRARVVACAALGLLCTVPLWHFIRDYEWSYDHQRIARAIQARMRPGDALLFVHPYEAFYYRWYLGPDVSMLGLVFTALEDQGTYMIKPPDMDVESAWSRIQQFCLKYDRFWLVGQSSRSFASNADEERRLLDRMDRLLERLDELPRAGSGEPVVRLYGATAGNR